MKNINKVRNQKISSIILNNIYREELINLQKDLESRSEDITPEETYLYLQFFQEAIIPLIAASIGNNNELVKRFQDNKNTWEADNSTLFSGEGRNIVLHFIHTGVFRESHKNNIRAWALAHKKGHATNLLIGAR